MININEVIETNKMILEENLDVRTITMGISLLDCKADTVEKVCDKIYAKITDRAKNLVSVGQEIEKEYGIPIVNKRISVTPIALVGGGVCETTKDFVKIAKTLDKAAKEVGVNLIGGYSALPPATYLRKPPSLCRCGILLERGQIHAPLCHNPSVHGRRLCLRSRSFRYPQSCG